MYSRNPSDEIRERISDEVRTDPKDKGRIV